MKILEKVKSLFGGCKYLSDANRKTILSAFKMPVIEISPDTDLNWIDGKLEITEKETEDVEVDKDYVTVEELVELYEELSPEDFNAHSACAEAARHPELMEMWSDLSSGELDAMQEAIDIVNKNRREEDEFVAALKQKKEQFNKLVAYKQCADKVYRDDGGKWTQVNGPKKDRAPRHMTCLEAKKAGYRRYFERFSDGGGIYKAV